MDRDLLWRAWPDGYLAMRGVKTVGGWQCIAASELGSWYKPGAAVDVAQEVGDLLPNVDPSDTATWACLLKDLAGAMGQTADKGYEGFVMSWSMTTRTTAGGTVVYINCQPIELVFTTDDPAEALVRARIQLREAADNG